jgi:hypothetical protein
MRKRTDPVRIEYGHMIKTIKSLEKLLSRITACNLYFSGGSGAPFSGSIFLKVDDRDLRAHPNDYLVASNELPTLVPV